MSRTLEFKESAHLDQALTDPATGTLNADKLLGRWTNTNTKTQGISEIIIEENDGKFTVTATGVGSDGPIPWPTSQAQVLANLEEEAGQRAVALAVNFEFDFMTSETYLRVNKGVLVIVVFNTFQDDSGRSNYVNREFFYRQE